MSTEEILQRFGANQKKSRQAYEHFISDGITQGKRSDLTGGGLVRNAGGWQEVKSAKENGFFLWSDERILGDSDFVTSVMTSAEEEFERKSGYRQRKIDIDALIALVAKTLGIEEDEVCATGKQPCHVQARSLFCYWAVRELGITATSLAKKLGLSQPAITQAVTRGEHLATEKGWHLADMIGESNL
jgi:hypothetical protein